MLSLVYEYYERKEQFIRKQINIFVKREIDK
jgi:hypothetical protein